MSAGSSSDDRDDGCDAAVAAGDGDAADDPDADLAEPDEDSHATGTEESSEDVTALGDVLEEFKRKGCNLLVVGEAPRRVFTRASGGLLGGPEATRYRLLAITDASPQSVGERLPDPERTPDSLSETTKLVNHALPPRSVREQDADGAGLGAVSESRVVDPQLAGLQAELAEAMAAFDRQADGLRPAELRVGVDSLGALFEHYDESVVRRCLRLVTGYVQDYSAMGHYVLAEPFESDRVQSLIPEFDAVVEVRAVDPMTHDHDAEERWHVAEYDLTTDWFAQ